MPRDLTQDEKEVVRQLYQAKTSHKDVSAFCTAATELVLHKWNGTHPVEQNTAEVKVKPGTTLKIVMVSRFGDFGLTDDLEESHGYSIRVMPDGGEICDIRFCRLPTWHNDDAQLEDELDRIAREVD